jgi:hypothetical protein
VNAATCQVLASIFPVILLTVVVEGRRVHRNLRRLKLFRALSQGVVSASLIGLTFSVIGVATTGLGWESAMFDWAAIATDVLGLAILMLMLLATPDIEDALLEPDESGSSKVEP